MAERVRDSLGVSVRQRGSVRNRVRERDRGNVIGTASTSLLAAAAWYRHYALIIICHRRGARAVLSQKRVNARVRRSLRCVLHFVG